MRAVAIKVVVVLAHWIEKEEEVAADLRYSYRLSDSWAKEGMEHQRRQTISAPSSTRFVTTIKDRCGEFTLSFFRSQFVVRIEGKVCSLPPFPVRSTPGTVLVHVDLKVGDVNCEVGSLLETETRRKGGGGGAVVFPC